MACYLSSVLYVQLPPRLTGETLAPDSIFKFLSLPGSPTYLLLPSYWPLSSLVNQLEGALGRQGRTETYLQTV